MMWILAIMCVPFIVGLQAWAEHAENAGRVRTQVIMNVLTAILGVAFVALLVAGAADV